MYVVVANLFFISCSRFMYVLVVEVKTDVYSCFYGNVSCYVGYVQCFETLPGPAVESVNPVSKDKFGLGL